MSTENWWLLINVVGGISGMIIGGAQNKQDRMVGAFRGGILAVVAAVAVFAFFILFGMW